MRDQRPPNPYIDASLQDLYAACQSRAGDLLAPPAGPRTPAERLALALDTGHLLLAVAAHIAASEHVPGSPEQAMKNTPHKLAEVFGEYGDGLMRQARYAVLVRACNYVFGGRGESWRREAELDGQRASDLAIGSDAGLHRVLEHLEAITHAKGWRPPLG